MASSSTTLVRHRIEDGLALVEIDVDGQSVNTLSTPMIEHFEALLDAIEGDSEVRGVVITSAKTDNFVAGFDIEELQGYYHDPDALRALVKRGQALMARLEALPLPVVAAIDGSCLGGGLELALACDARITTENPRSVFGLPEVMLGLIPGGGGTQRLPRLIDLSQALDLILTGRQINARKALKIGLVDDVVHPGILLDVAREKVRKLANEPGAGPSLGDNLEEAFNDPVKLAARTPARRLIFSRAREQVLKESGGNYPAPLKALDVIETGFSEGFAAGLRAEGEAFTELVRTPEARNLMNIFFMRQEVNKDRVVDGRVKARPIHRLGVIGAGLMGAGIAQVAAYNGTNVRLKDASAPGLGWGMNYIDDLLKKAARRKKLTEAQADIALGRVAPTLTYEGFERCDLVIEAVFENTELKQSILAELEAQGNTDQIFASNTSTIPIKTIATKSKRPENVLGMHFFSPVHKMPLLEIIRTEKTSPKALATALAYGRELGKTCIVVDDGPGFFTSRVIGAYINEAGWILQEGGKIEEIDGAMRGFGFPVGPLKLVDEVGMDVALKAAGVLQEAFKERWDAPEGLRVLAEQGRKGRKNKRGFYDYASGDSRAPDTSVYDALPGGATRRHLDAETITRRCWLAMLNECAYALDEGIIRSPRDGDIGVIFGLGFPPFRGGIFRHADEVGLGWVVDTMHTLAGQYGDRLRPAPILERMAEKGERFYED
ncbi:fatty acid oxidation complex subunit alpha FadJ [Lujinxingia vulgaris]|uniref:enoyl-CoA hydratase n=1 Tax=Lujinxingia vulgaris TaxID=2600176 RepID=A0A5C6X7V5_9DELT|nr:3-hydroxyacyl-CoA dehydrogenase NAD-binding domain-containing protein [Lujinxingia vulgaris]TXD35820.1 fatty acid oxidation complex subunit alpha FadJ [Lujinxingia vulgaris]